MGLGAQVLDPKWTQPSVHSRGSINGQICLKFGTYGLGESLEDIFFSFFKNYEFGGSGDLVLDPKGTENLWGGLGKP